MPATEANPKELELYSFMGFCYIIYMCSIDTCSQPHPLLLYRRCSEGWGWLHETIYSIVLLT